MSQLGTKNPVFNDGRTKQSFADETDINKILKRAQKTGTISHLSRFEPRFGDFSNFDFSEAQLKLAQGREIFDALPPELRSEFSNRPGDFFQYVNDPANKERLGELLPALAAPGRQNIPIKGNIPADDAKVLEQEQTPAPTPDPDPNAAPAVTEGVKKPQLPPVQPIT